MNTEEKNTVETLWATNLKTQEEIVDFTANLLLVPIGFIVACLKGLGEFLEVLAKPLAILLLLGPIFIGCVWAGLVLTTSFSVFQSNPILKAVIVVSSIFIGPVVVVGIICAIINKLKGLFL